MSPVKYELACYIPEDDILQENKTLYGRIFFNIRNSHMFLFHSVSYFRLLRAENIYA
jgi:hypothetical protein